MNTIVLQGLELFARVWMLPVAVVACVMVAWIGWRIDARRRTRLARLGDVPVLERLVPRRTAGLPPRVRAVMLGVSALCIGVALAGPRWGERPERRRDVGVDIALVLDVSASMLARDEGVSRWWWRAAATCLRPSRPTMTRSDCSSMDWIPAW
jgi:hypothetical protein